MKEGTQMYRNSLAIKAQAEAKAANYAPASRSVSALNQEHEPSSWGHPLSPSRLHQPAKTTGPWRRNYLTHVGDSFAATSFSVKNLSITY